MRRALVALSLVANAALGASGEGGERVWVHLRTHGLTELPIEVSVEIEPADGGEATRRMVLEAPGSVELPLAGSGPWSIRALATGTWSAPLSIAAPPAASYVVNLWPETRVRARLQVRGGDQLPTAVGVRLQSAGARAPRELREATMLCPVDEDGRLECRLPRVAGVDLRLRAPGFASRFFWDLDLSGRDSHDLGVVPLRAGGSVVGRVAVRAGYALDEVMARLEPLAAPNRAAVESRVGRQTEVEVRPDERGFFALEGLPAGSYRLRVLHPELAMYELSPMRVIEGGQSEVTERIDLVEPFSGYLPKAGEWDIEVEAIDRPVRRRTRSVTLEPEGDGAPAILHLRVPDTVLRGQVVDERGSPVPDAVVTVTDPLHSTRDVSTSTDRDGRFEIQGLDEGAIQAQAEHRPPDGEPASSAPARVDLAEGVAAPHLRLVLRPHARLFGRLLSAGGNAVSNAWIEAQPFTSAGVLDALFAQPRDTDAGGRFEISLPRTTAVVQFVAFAPGHPLTQRPLGLGDVVLGTASGSLIVDLPRRVAEIPWNDPSQPRPGLVRGESKLPLALLSRWAAANGVPWQPDGRHVEIPMLEPGGYRVCWFGTADWLLLGSAGRDCVSVSVPAGGTSRAAVPAPSEEIGTGELDPPR